MSFLQPLILGGLAAVGLPVIIHLLNKFRVRRTQWGAMRLLADCVKQNQRRVKFDDLILLLLRCALIALIALAFARPVLKGPATGDESSGPVAAVILLDHSASMSRTAGSTTMFDKARSEIKEWLEKQDRQSQLALILASKRTVPLLPRPVGDFALFRQSLDQAACGDHGGDFSGALRQAADALATVSGHRKEIRIYTDGQATAFTRADELASIAREHPDITIVPVLIGEPPHDNLGIVAMRLEGGIPSIGQPVKFRIEILNSGAAPARDIAVNLKFGDGAPAGTASIPLIAPGETRSASVSVNFQAPGPNSVTAEIPTDSFEADNRVSCAIDVLSRLDAAIVTPDFEAPDQETAAFFLERALVPVPRDQVARHFLAPSRMRLADLPASIGQPNGERPELVFLCDPGPVSDEIAMALFLYIETGGNLVVIPGERGVDGWSEDGMFATLLPAHPSAAQDAESLNWQSSNHSHPVTDLWNDPSNGDLGTVRFSRYHPLSLKPPLNGRAWEAARPIVSFTNGEPAVAEWTYGNGTVILFAANLTREWTNQALHPSFVPFLERLMAHLNRANEARLILRPGETFRKPVAASFTGKDFSVKTPLSPTARTAGQANGEPDGPYVRYSSTDKTGAYEVFIEDEHVATFAVQPDPDESDFSPVEDSILNSLTEVPRDDSSPEARWIVRRDFWPALIWCAAALFLAEAALGHRNSHARQAA